MKNKIALAGDVWIASDIHLGPDTPATARAFHHFLGLAAERASALLLLGDIFDAWVGDDFALKSPPPWLAEALIQLAAVSARIPLFLGRGNRDFLIGAALARRVGGGLIPQPLLLQTDGGTLLLSHGDEYCTADKNYQRFRAVVRCPVIQGVFLSLSLNTRLKIANWARSRSTTANQSKSAHIMDVDPETVRQAWTDHEIDIVVHGHTHRPDVHTETVQGRERRRIVLPDWDYDHQDVGRGGWLSANALGQQLHSANFEI